MISIVHVIPHLSRGGAEMQLVQLAEHQSIEGHDVTVLCMSASPELQGRLERSGAIVPEPAGSLLGLLRSLRSMQRSVDIVHSWMYHAFVIAAMTRSRLRTRQSARHVWAIRRTDPTSSGLSRRTRAVATFAARLSKRSADGLIACTDAALVRHRRAGYAGQVEQVVLNAVPTSAFDVGADSDAGPGAGGVDGHADPVVLRCGALTRLSHDKGIDILLEAWAVVLGTHPTARLVLGGPGIVDDDQELRALIDRFGLDESVELVGPTDDPASFHRALDLYVSPSRTEGFPNVVAEAMAAGTPVVATDVGGTAEVVGDAGILVRAERPRDLASAVIGLLDDPGRRAELGSAGQTRVRSEFTIEATASATAEVYRRVLVRESDEAASPS